MGLGEMGACGMRFVEKGVCGMGFGEQVIWGKGLGETSIWEKLDSGKLQYSISRKFYLRVQRFSQ